MCTLAHYKIEKESTLDLFLVRAIRLDAPCNPAPNKKRRVCASPKEVVESSPNRVAKKATRAKIQKSTTADLVDQSKTNLDKNVDNTIQVIEGLFAKQKLASIAKDSDNTNQVNDPPRRRSYRI